MFKQPLHVWHAKKIFVKGATRDPLTTSLTEILRIYSESDTKIEMQINTPRSWHTILQLGCFYLMLELLTEKDLECKKKKKRDRIEHFIFIMNGDNFHYTVSKMKNLSLLIRSLSHKYVFRAMITKELSRLL